MPSRLKKISLFFLAILILIAGFCGGIIDKKDYQARASLLDAIRAWVTINPLEVDVSVPVEVGKDRIFRVTAEVTNKGEEKIENAKGEIALPEEEGLVLLKKNPVQKIGAIACKKSKRISWTVRGTKEGNYVITVLANGELKGDLISAEDSAMIIVGNENFRSPPHPRKWYQDFFDFFRGWFNRNK